MSTCIHGLPRSERCPYCRDTPVTHGTDGWPTGTMTQREVREAEGLDPDQRIAIVGGCGRVGLPLGIAFASRGKHVTLYDVDTAAVRMVNDGHMPFGEQALLDLVDPAGYGSIHATDQPDDPAIHDADVVILTIGTPVDEHLNPDPSAVPVTVRTLAPNLRGGQLLVLRSTLYPGTTVLVERCLVGLGIDVVTCPERIAEGQALTELFELPQIIGAREQRVTDRAADLFKTLTDDIVEVTPEEAEMAKLITNAWRYITFAAANQFYMLATNAGLNYVTIRNAVTHGYPRAAGLPSAGFAAGPCLLKDTLQLAAFADNTFGLGHAAMLVNEGLPLYLATRLDQRYGLAVNVVGILGMSFKGDSDDTRDSLAFKLRKVMMGRALDVICHDPRVDDGRFAPDLDEVLDYADLLIVAAPHAEYRDLKTDLPVVDLWGITGRGIKL